MEPAHSYKNLIVYQKAKELTRGSSFEVDYWLDVLTETTPGYKLKLQEFITRNNELSKMLTSMMKNLEKKISQTA